MFLLSGVKSEKDKKSVSKYNNVGEIRISLSAIESIALNASKNCRYSGQQGLRY